MLRLGLIRRRMATKQPWCPASEPDEADSGRAQRPDFYGLPARKTRRNDKWTLVAKPRKAIHIYETGHGFRLNDRKLFNCLLYYAEVSMAWEKGASAGPPVFVASTQDLRSEEHKSELQSLMRNSYAVFCLTQTTNTTHLVRPLLL